MMGHSVDESVRHKTSNECFCNRSQNIDQEEQIQDLWSSNSIRDSIEICGAQTASDIQVY